MVQWLTYSTFNCVCVCVSLSFHLLPHLLSVALALYTWWQDCTLACVVLCVSHFQLCTLSFTVLFNSPGLNKLGPKMDMYIYVNYLCRYVPIPVCVKGICVLITTSISLLSVNGVIARLWGPLPRVQAGDAGRGGSGEERWVHTLIITLNCTPPHSYLVHVFSSVLLSVFTYCVWLTILLHLCLDLPHYFS